MRALFIINPVAGRGAALKAWKKIERQVAGDRRFDAVTPDTAAGTRKAAVDAVRAGYDRVIVVGGDGTLLSVANELAMSDTALGVIPAGTGNDFCRNSGIPRRLEEALAIATGPYAERIDLGMATGGRRFLNSASVGFDAEVAARASQFPSGLGGALPYLLAAFATLFRYRPVHADVTVDDQRYSGPVTLINVANGIHYGGGVPIAPLARRDDGMLDVVIAGGLSPWRILSLMPSVYMAKHLRNPVVKVLRGQHVRIQVSEPVRAQADGEPLLWDSLHFQVQPKALAVAMPATAARAEIAVTAPRGRKSVRG